MQMLKRAWLLKAMIVLWAAYSFFWMMQEGDLWRVLFLGVWTALLGLGYGYGRVTTHFQFEGWMTVFTTAIAGALLGLGSVLMTLLLMAVKTGLHAHGPEFSTAEIAWLMQQAPLWTLAGLIGGAGLGLLHLAVSRSSI
jgi:hypothetical protein